MEFEDGEIYPMYTSEDNSNSMYYLEHLVVHSIEKENGILENIVYSYKVVCNLTKKKVPLFTTFHVVCLYKILHRSG